MLKKKIEDEQYELLYKYSSSKEPLIHSVVTEVHSKDIFFTLHYLPILISLTLTIRIG